MNFKKFAAIAVLLFRVLCPYSAFASDSDIVILPHFTGICKMARKS